MSNTPFFPFDYEPPVEEPVDESAAEGVVPAVEDEFNFNAIEAQTDSEINQIISDALVQHLPVTSDVINIPAVQIEVASGSQSEPQDQKTAPIAEKETSEPASEDAPAAATTSKTSDEGTDEVDPSISYAFSARRDRRKKLKPAKSGQRGILKAATRRKAETERRIKEAAARLLEDEPSASSTSQQPPTSGKSSGESEELSSDPVKPSPQPPSS